MTSGLILIQRDGDGYRASYDAGLGLCWEVSAVGLTRAEALRNLINLFWTWSAEVEEYLREIERETGDERN